MNAKHKAIAKKVGDRFAKNPFAHKYKKTLEGREEGRRREHAVPEGHRRDRSK